MTAAVATALAIVCVALGAIAFGPDLARAVRDRPKRPGRRRQPRHHVPDPGTAAAGRAPGREAPRRRPRGRGVRGVPGARLPALLRLDPGRRHRLRLPDLSAQADRQLRCGDRRAPQRALRLVSRPHRAGGRPAPSRRRRRAGEVDGPARRRARPDQRGEHAPSRTAARPRPRPARPRQVERVDQPIITTEHGAMSTETAELPTPAFRRGIRRPRPGGSPRLHEGHRLRRRRAQAADDRHRQHLDRGDAVQLPPAGVGRAHQGGRARGRRDADGVQHDCDLGRDHDGHEGHEELARQSRGDRRFDRADRPRLPVRRRDRPRRLRQDAARLRDGAGPARHPLAAALRRIDRARPLQGPRRHHPRRLRSRRRRTPPGR